MCGSFHPAAPKSLQITAGFGKGQHLVTTPEHLQLAPDDQSTPIALLGPSRLPGQQYSALHAILGQGCYPARLALHLPHPLRDRERQRESACPGAGSGFHLQPKRSTYSAAALGEAELAVEPMSLCCRERCSALSAPTRCHRESQQRERASEEQVRSTTPHIKTPWYSRKAQVHRAAGPACQEHRGPTSAVPGGAGEVQLSAPQHRHGGLYSFTLPSRRRPHPASKALSRRLHPCQPPPT